MSSDDSEILLPDAAPLINSLRAIGYSIETAIADIIDNSIDAKANIISIDMIWEDNKSYIRIEDNGTGMDESNLKLAMKIGSVDPATERKDGILGRFGMGLKTASFSLGKRLTVLTKKDENSLIRCWDLDHIARTNKWSLLKKAINSSSMDILGKIYSESGTVVLIEELDRVIEKQYSTKKVKKFYNKIKLVEDHLAMVFHRFMAGPNRISLFINGNQIQPWDPFLTSEIATQELPPENVSLNDDIIKIQPYILPHHSKLTSDEFEQAAGPKGWLEQQGFYIYRNKRLLVSGSWLHLFGREDAYKLSRIKIDITNRSDFDWQIDIKKSNAKPPQELVSLLRKIGEKTRKKSHEVFYQRSVKNISKNNQSVEFIWEQVSTKNNTYFRLNKANSNLKELYETDSEYLAKLKFYLFHIEEYCPANLVAFNLNQQKNLENEEITIEQKNKIKILIDVFKDNDLSIDEIIEQLISYDTFRMCKEKDLTKVVYDLIGGQHV